MLRQDRYRPVRSLTDGLHGAHQHTLSRVNTGVQVPITNNPWAWNIYLMDLAVVGKAQPTSFLPMNHGLHGLSDRKTPSLLIINSLHLASVCGVFVHARCLVMAKIRSLGRVLMLRKCLCFAAETWRNTSMIHFYDTPPLFLGSRDVYYKCLWIEKKRRRVTRKSPVHIFSVIKFFWIIFLKPILIVSNRSISNSFPFHGTICSKYVPRWRFRWMTFLRRIMKRRTHQHCWYVTKIKHNSISLHVAKVEIKFSDARNMWAGTLRCKRDQQKWFFNFFFLLLFYHILRNLGRDDEYIILMILYHLKLLRGTGLALISTVGGSTNILTGHRVL